MTVAARDRRPIHPAASAASSTLPSTLPAASQAIVLAVIAAGALATIALWWNDTTAIHGFGDWLTNAGRMTGLLAGYGVVVLVALMARIPPLERGIGADQLARWHAHGRPIHRQPRRRARTADHLGLRGHRPHQRGRARPPRC